MKALPPGREPERISASGPVWVVFEVARRGRVPQQTLHLTEVGRVSAANRATAIYSVAETRRPLKAGEYDAILLEDISPRKIHVNFYITMEGTA